MSIAVLKFGGSSVSTIEKIKFVAKKIIKEKKRGYNIVTVISAPGDMTDELIQKAKQISKNPPPREIDALISTGELMSAALLAISLEELGHDVISLSGPQAGIYADTSYTKAKIVDIKPKKILKEIKNGKIVVVAGFQGLNPYDDITTLGRGGSDLTAIALAAVLKAKKCEIYTDVEGVYTADPRVVPDAKKIKRLSYDEMLEIASAGAGVMQARAVEFAKKYNVSFEVKSTFSNKSGTIISKEAPMMEKFVVSGVAYDTNLAKISILDVPDKPGIAALIFGELAKENINVDMIIQSAAKENVNDISFTIAQTDLDKTVKILENVNKKLNSGGIIYDDKVAKISIVGVGMRSHPGVAARMFKALSDKNINIEMISTSEIKISCVIKSDRIKEAVLQLHKAFKLKK